MRRVFCPILVLAVAVIIVTGNKTAAGDGCCAHCGHSGSCQKVCRLVCEEKKVDITCWGCKCEDFCLPGPSKPGCQHCEQVCEAGSDPKGPTCVQSKNFVWTEWFPCTAKISTKKKLMKKVVTKEIPSFKWVVEDLCNDCEVKCGGADVPHGAEVPAPPVADAKLKYGQFLPPVPEIETR